MSKKNTPKGMVAIRVHDGSITKVTYGYAPAKGDGKHYNPKKRSGINRGKGG